MHVRLTSRIVTILCQEKFSLYIQVILNNLLICCMIKNGSRMNYSEEDDKPPPYMVDSFCKRLGLLL